MQRRLDSNGDWSFGAGKQDYLSGVPKIIQDLTTRLKEWKYDCFFNNEGGIDYRTRLDRNQEKLLYNDIKIIASGIQGILGIKDITYSLDNNRRFTFSANLILFDNSEYPFNFIL